MGKVWMIASGKGGVGKSSISAALASAFVSSHLRVLVLDADVGLRSLDLMLGMQDRVLYELTDCVNRRCTLDEALVPHHRYPLLHLLSAGQDARPKDFVRKDLGRTLKTLRPRYDMILIDAPAGIGRGIKNFIGLADRFILVATPDDICLRDTEKTGRILSEDGQDHPGLVLNRYDWQLARQGAIPMPQHLATAMDMPLLGVIPQDDSIYRALLSGRTMAEEGAPRVTAAVEGLADRLQGLPTPIEPPKERLADRMRRLFEKEVGRP